MISVIIPTFNEAAQIEATIIKLRQHDEDNFIVEIIIADGGSTDNTILLAEQMGARIAKAPNKGRAAQMNFGAGMATGSILYFLHADTIPPPKFSTDIMSCMQNNFGAGCFRLAFDKDHWFLKANCWFTRFDINAFRFGDQSLFADIEIFKKSGGFSEKMLVLEDQEFINRIRKITRFTIIKKPVITSARKYIENGIYKTQVIFFIIYSMYRLGYSQQKLISTYKKMIVQDKL